jgi:hypothetical protein
MPRVVFDPEGFMSLSLTQRADICMHMAGCVVEWPRLQASRHIAASTCSSQKRGVNSH